VEVDIEDESACVDCVDVIEFDIGEVESDKKRDMFNDELHP
jgi:hypothetical protein